MKIPKRFKLFNHEINVEISDILMREEALWGVAKYGSKKITIENSLETTNKEQTFLHELVHMILEHMQEFKLSKKEKFVNTFSELLYQAFETMKY